MNSKSTASASRIAAVLAMTAAVAGAQQFEHRKERAPLTLSKRLHVNPLIAPPDTMELEWGGAFSTGGGFALPAAIRYTPEGPYVFWGRTELSVVFDSLNDSANGAHFSDRMTFGATCVLRDGEKLDIALEPTATVLLRGDSGTRLGATGVVRYDAGQSSAGVTLGWTEANHVSATNPAGTVDLGFGYGYQLRPSGPLNHLTAHANWLYEKSTGVERQISISEGVEYQITDAVAVDFTAQHNTVWGGQVDHQVVVGLTINTPRIRKR